MFLSHQFPPTTKKHTTCSDCNSHQDTRAGRTNIHNIIQWRGRKEKPHTNMFSFDSMLFSCFRVRTNRWSFFSRMKARDAKCPLAHGPAELDTQKRTHMGIHKRAFVYAQMNVYMSRTQIGSRYKDEDGSHTRTKLGARNKKARTYMIHLSSNFFNHLMEGGLVTVSNSARSAR